MTVLLPCNHAALLLRPACAFLGGATAFGVSISFFEALGCGFAGWRGAASFREEGRVDRGGVQEPTDRGPDKRPQGAALSVGCFFRFFSLIRQCSARARNVCAAINALPILSFPHIAGAGDG
jgi:hypothetical protein